MQEVCDQIDILVALNIFKGSDDSLGEYSIWSGKKMTSLIESITGAVKGVIKTSKRMGYLHKRFNEAFNEALKQEGFSNINKSVTISEDLTVDYLAEKAGEWYWFFYPKNISDSATSGLHQTLETYLRHLIAILNTIDESELLKITPLKIIILTSSPIQLASGIFTLEYYLRQTQSKPNLQKRVKIKEEEILDETLFNQFRDSGISLWKLEPKYKIQNFPDGYLEINVDEISIRKHVNVNFPFKIRFEKAVADLIDSDLRSYIQERIDRGEQIQEQLLRQAIGSSYKNGEAKGQRNVVIEEVQQTIYGDLLIGGCLAGGLFLLTGVITEYLLSISGIDFTWIFGILYILVGIIAFRMILPTKKPSDSSPQEIEI
ncbi:MAG: hypothetical protein ACFE9L_05775 [Candidatus Hodarchaeota archaeon]